MAQQIIKKEAAEGMSPQPFNFASIEASARQIVEQARVEAQTLINRARSEVDKLRAEVRGQELEIARREGFNKGYDEGLVKGAEDGRQQAFDQRTQELNDQTSGVVGSISAMAQQLDAHHKLLADQAQRDLIALAFAVAEKLTRKTFEQNTDAIRSVLISAIDLTLSRSSVDVFAAPEDAAAIEVFLPELRKVFTDIGAVRIYPDASIERGSVAVKAGRGEVAMRLNEQLDTIVHDILGVSAREATSILRTNG